MVRDSSRTLPYIAHYFQISTAQGAAILEGRR